MTKKNAFFEGWSRFGLNNLRLALSMNLKFYTSVAKGLKLQVRKFSYVCRSYKGKTGSGVLFAHPPHWIGLRGYIFNIWGAWLSKLKIWNILLPFCMGKISILTILRGNFFYFFKHIFFYIFLNFSIKTSF